MDRGDTCKPAYTKLLGIYDGALAIMVFSSKILYIVLLLYTQSCCLAAGALYTIVGLTKWGFCLSCFYRTKMRKQYMLEKSPCNDWFCELCALCQEHRELKSHGFNPSIGN